MSKFGVETMVLIFSFTFLPLIITFKHTVIIS